MFYSVINTDDIRESEFKYYYSLMPDERKNKYNKLRNIDDKKTCIGAYMLLCRIVNNDNLKFCYTKTGKPYINNNPFYFSLSHSGKYAAAAVSGSPVGIDIENISDVRDSVIRHVCTDNEIKYINETGIESFYKIWTYKEAYFKMTGDGIGAGLKTVDYTKRSENVISLTKNGYALCVISD